MRLRLLFPHMPPDLSWVRVAWCGSHTGLYRAHRLCGWASGAVRPVSVWKAIFLWLAVSRTALKTSDLPRSTPVGSLSTEWSRAHGGLSLPAAVAGQSVCRSRVQLLRRSWPRCRLPCRSRRLSVLVRQLCRVAVRHVAACCMLGVRCLVRVCGSVICVVHGRCLLVCFPLVSFLLCGVRVRAFARDVLRGQAVCAQSRMGPPLGSTCVTEPASSFVSPGHLPSPAARRRVRDAHVGAPCQEASRWLVVPASGLRGRQRQRHAWKSRESILRRGFALCPLATRVCRTPLRGGGPARCMHAGWRPPRAHLPRGVRRSPDAHRDVLHQPFVKHANVAVPSRALNSRLLAAVRRPPAVNARRRAMTNRGRSSAGIVSPQRCSSGVVLGGTS